MSRYLTKEQQNKRGTFFYEMPHDPDHAISIFCNRGGGLTVAVCEEQAVDSYNKTFELDIAIPPDEALRLRDYLNEHFPKS